MEEGERPVRFDSLHSSLIGVPHQTAEDRRQSTSSGSFFKKSDFLDPLVRINGMKFLTSKDTRIAHYSRFACLDLRLKKVPKLTEIFRPNNPALAKGQGMMPVFELDLQVGQHLREHHFDSMSGYSLVIVLSNSLEVEFPSKKHESAVYEKVCHALRKRSQVGLLKGGA